MKSIDTDKIIETIEAQDIKVVSIHSAEFKSILLAGDLESFITTVKAFNEKVVFLQSFELSEHDFIYESAEDVLGEYDQSPGEKEIELIRFLPELKEYKSYLGQTSFLIFWVFYNNRVFEYWHKAEWFDAFTKSFEEARKIFEEQETSLKHQQTEQQKAEQEKIEQREKYLHDLLEELAGDDKFISLKTQKAKLEYALVRYPELSELPQHQLKDDISNINARIEARKMLE